MFGYYLTPFGYTKIILKDYASIFEKYKKLIFPMDWDSIVIELRNDIEKYNESTLNELNELRLEIFYLKEKYDTNFSVATTSLMFSVIAVIFAATGIIISGVELVETIETLKNLQYSLYIILCFLGVVYCFFNRKIEYNKRKELFLKIYFEIIISKIESIEKK